MSDQRDSCAICLEAFAPGESLWPFYGGPFSPGRLLSWPCGHRVHIACILQSQTSLRSMDAPCFLCRTPAFFGVRTYFEQWHAREIALVAADATPLSVPAEPVNAVYVPHRVAALCCPRVLPLSDDRLDTRTLFVELQDDRRMTFMGLDRDTGALHWTCLSCNQELSIMELPGPELCDSRVCWRHGDMCFAFDCRGAEPLQPFWSCMDHHLSRNDVALPISHLRTIDAMSMPIQLVSSDDEEFDDRSSTSSGFDWLPWLMEMQQDTCIHQLVYLKARLQPHPCCIGHNANILKRGGTLRSAYCKD
jgi:hypothetical protein